MRDRFWSIQKTGVARKTGRQRRKNRIWSIAAAEGASRDTSDSFAVGIGGSSSNGRIPICISLSCHQSSSNEFCGKNQTMKAGSRQADIWNWWWAFRSPWMEEEEFWNDDYRSSSIKTWQAQEIHGAVSIIVYRRRNMAVQDGYGGTAR